ncbi:hypothetical protein ElyMa_003582600 [Elysia marginata]|uniref:Uncharacterized protein n=1 Tax=Elysia marginata TaxID=1093978 RepID=A0AAV4EN86_9GAST|nr:hypothetical protein ElyMa_003582600 [Elysia marginata]
MSVTVRTTNCRLLPMLGAVTLLVLLACQVSVAQEDDTSTDATTTTTETNGISNNKRYGRGNIIIGGAFGLNDREKRRAGRRRGGAETFSISKYISEASGKRRKNRRRGGKNDANLDTDSDTNTAELTNNIDRLAELNQAMADRAAEQEQQRRER